MAKKLKRLAVFFADSHLQERAWAHRPIEGDSYFSFQQIIEYACEHGLPAIGAGDLLDRHRNTPEPVAVIHQMMERMHDENLAFYFLEGQHEMGSNTAWFGVHDWPRSLHKRRIKVGPFNVYGLNYLPAGVLQEELKAIPKDIGILVAHQVWGDIMGDICVPQGGMHDVPACVSTVFTGDYHWNGKGGISFVPKPFKAIGAGGQDIKLISPGSTCMQSIDEPPQKFFTVLMEDGRFDYVKLKTRPHIEWDVISSADDMDRFVSEVGEMLTAIDESDLGLPPALEKPLLRVIYSWQLEDVKRRVQAAVGDRAHVFLKELSPKHEEIAEVVRGRSTESAGRGASLLSELPAFLKEHKLVKIQDTCQRLLEAPDVAGELSRMREECMTASTPKKKKKKLVGAK